MPIPFDIIVYLIMHIHVGLHNHGTCILARKVMHFPLPAGALLDLEADCTVMVVNHFVGVIAGSVHPKRMTFFDNLFNFLLYLRAKVCITLIYYQIYLQAYS